MSIQPPPSAREVQEFQFKLLARLRLFREDLQVPLKQSLNLVTTSSKFGLIFVASEDGFSVIQTTKVVEQCAGVRKPAAEVRDFPRRSVVLGALPSHLDVSCDNQHLAVSFTLEGSSVIRIYDVTSFTAQTERVINEMRLSSPLQALCWNPGIPNLLAACMQDGSAAVYEFKNNSFELSSIPVEAQSTCMCWSPKGKQIVIGSRNGSLNQFKPDLKIVKAIPPPQGGLSLVSVQWLSSLQYAVVYREQNSGSNMMIVNTPRNQPVTYINYEDITYSSSENRLTQFYFIHQQVWNMLLVGSSNSMEVGVLGSTPGGSEWEQWQLEDTARAELPLSASRQETHPVGMSIDTSVQHSLPWGENQQLPTMPLLLLMSHDGLLVLYWTLNILPGAANVCTPPVPLLDTSGLHLFIAPQPPVTSTQVSEAEKSQPAVGPIPLTQMPAFSSPPATATLPQWQLPPPATSSQPTWGLTPTPTKSVTKSTTTVAAQGSWLSSSSATTTFMSSLSQPAINPSSTNTMATPAFSVPTFAATPKPPNTQIPSSFASVQSASLFSHTGAFVSPTGPVNTSSGPVLQPTVELPQTTQAKVDLPAAPSPESTPVSLPSTPELLADATEESQELKALNETLIQDAMKEEIELFSWELDQLKERIRGIDLNVINNHSLDNIVLNIESMSAFMQELKDTTDVQESEVMSLRNFLLETFSFVESMKTRIYLQNNPDFAMVQSPQGLDPIQSRKMANIRSNLQYVDTNINRFTGELADKWNVFQISKKETRETMQIPSLESIYQAMVMQNNVIMRQKNLLEELEKKVKCQSHKKLMNILDVSRKVEESLLDSKDTELSKIAEDFLTLNLSKLRKNAVVEDIEESMANLDFSKTKLNISQPELSPEKIGLLQEVFIDSNIKYLESKITPVMSVGARQSSLLPIVTSNARSGSISSGQPVTQVTGKNTFRLNFANEKPLSSKSQPNLVTGTKQTTEDSLPKTQLSNGNSLKISSNAETILKQTPQISSSIFGSSLPKTIQFSQQNVQVSKDSLFNNENSSPVDNKTTSTKIFSANTPSSLVEVSQGPSSTPSAVPSKEFSFVPLVTTQASPFSSSFSFGSNTINPKISTSNPLHPFATNTPKQSSLSSGIIHPTTMVSSTLSPTQKNTEPANTSSLSTFSTPKLVSGENSFIANISTSESVPSSPLAHLSSLVSGIEPLDTFSGKSGSPNKGLLSSSDVTSTKPHNQPFVFSIPSLSDNKATNKDGTSDCSQKMLQSFAVENQESEKVKKDQTVDSGDSQTTFSGAFKNFSFGTSSSNTVFKSPLPTTSSKAETTTTFGGESIKLGQSPKSFFGSPSSSPFFSTSNTVTSSATQKSIFGGTDPLSCTVTKQEGKPTEISTPKSVSPDNSPVIEISLNSQKSPSDPKLSLEKLSSAASITITKVESAEKESPSKDNKPETITTTSSSIDSLNISSFTTPTKSPENIFSGSPAVKPSIMYEFSSSETQSYKEQSGESKPDDKLKKQETPKPLSVFGNIAPTSSTPTFSFGGSTPEDVKSLEKTQTKQSSGFSFGVTPISTNSETKTSNNITLIQTTSSFSFVQSQTQPTTQPSTTGFSFAVTTSAPATASSTFGFGNLATGVTDNKPKSAFSFGQQAQTQQNPAATTSNIFGGGFNLKPSETSTVFGGSKTGETIFGSAQSSNSGTKSIFGQTPTTNAEATNVFGQSTANKVSSPNEFSFSLQNTTTTQSSFFGTPTTTAATFFGQSICSPTPTTSAPFGQPNNTQSLFGNVTSSPFGGTSGFGSKPTFGQTGGSFFGQSSTFGASGGSVFGGSSSTAAASPSVFGGGASQPASPFGQSPGGGSGSVFGGGSFSGGGQTVGQTGFGTSPFQNKPAFGSTSPSAFGAPPAFGASPAFGGSPSFGNTGKIFGSPTSSTPAFGGVTQQQSSTFENLAGQNTMTFGNLAQNQSPSFGSMFPPQQNNPPPSTFSPSNNSSGTGFGGSSFSSWR